MANKKKQSADEIVDNLAEEMGVKDEKPDESKDDLAADLGGLFGVSSKKKKKKKKKEEEAPKAKEEPPAEEEEEEASDEDESSDADAGEDAEEADAGEAEEEEDVFDAISEAISDTLDDDDEEEEEKPKAKKKPAKKPEADKPAKKKSEGIDGIFAPAGGGGGGSDAPVVDDDPYLDMDDLGGASAGGTNKALVGVIVVLVLALVGVVLGTTSVGKDIMLVFKGEYRAQKDADKQAKEDAYKAEQEAALPKFGNLSIQGSPKYASITHNGETYYGEISAGMREMQLNPGYSNIGNLSIKEKQVVTVSAPGFTPKTFEITEGMWQGSKGAYNYMLTATLVPVDVWAGNEFDARMSSDTENEYFGKMVIKTVPEGATVMLNNKPLLDEKGEPLKTPVSIEKNYVKDDKGKLEEVPIKVDTVFDEGHKLVVSFPDQPDMPAYANQINRQLWACNKKTEDEIKKLPADHSIQMECNYVYEKTIDFNQIKAFKKRMDEKRKEIEEYNKKVKELRAKQLEGKDLDPSAVEAVQK